jgi:hypothetical protein
VSAVQARRDAQARVNKARRELDLLFSRSALHPPVGAAAEALHLEQQIEAWTELGSAYFAATSGYRQGSLPHSAMVDQHRATANYVTRLRADLAAKQAEAVRLRGER